MALNTRLCDLLGTRVPIVQAPITGEPELALAVAGAGALGMVSLTWLEPAAIPTLMEAVGEATVAVNLVLEWPQDERVELALEHGARIVSLAWGDPAPFAERIHSAGAILLATAGTAEEARRFEAAGVDAAALDHGLDDVGGEIVGANTGERAPVGAHRGANRVDYIGLGHRAEPYPCQVGFILGTVAMLLFLVGVLLVVGHFYPGSSADLVDWMPTRSPEVEAQNEIDDIRQMMEAQNEMRRRRGAPEMTERELHEKVDGDERDRLRLQGPSGAA